MALGSLIGAGIGLVGSAISSKAQKSAAKKAAAASAFRPYDTSNLFGSTSWDTKTGTLSQSLSPFAQGVAGQVQGLVNAGLAGPWQGLGQQLQLGALGNIDSLIAEANAYGLPPEALFQGVMAGMAGVGNNPQLDNLFSMAAGNPYGLEQIQMGRNLMGNDYSQVAADRLNLLRQNAAPFEERATNSLMNRLFSQGRLGSTGGGRDIEAFARGLAQADTSRQLEAQGFAEQLYGRDQALGANLFSGGVGNYLQGISTAGSLGLNRGNQQLAALQSLYDVGTGWNQLGYSRANDRIARAEGLFGFGEAVGNTGLRQAGTGLGILSGLSQEQNALAQLGITAGGGQASAGANAGAFGMAAAGSPVGGFLQGLGGGILTGQNTAASDLSTLFGRLFGRSGTPASITADDYYSIMQRGY